MEEAQRLEIGERITQLREQSPFTQPLMASKIGIGLRAYQKLEAKGTTKWERVEEIAEIHGADPHWIWTGREKGPTPDLLAALNGDPSAQLAAIRSDLQEVLDWVRAQKAVPAQDEDVPIPAPPEGETQPGPSRTARQRSASRETRRAAGGSGSG